MWHTYTEKEHNLRSMRGYFAYVYANGAHVLLVWGHKSITPHGFYRSNRSKRVAMRGYFAYVYANGAHVEVHEELICIRIRKRITF